MTKEQYIKNYGRRKWKKGDRVKVLRKARTNEKGWPNIWVKGMNDSVGQVLQITRIYENKDIELNDNRCNFCYPYFVLRKMPKRRNK